MRSLIPASEIDAAMDDLRWAVDRLVELGTYREPLRAPRADGALRDIRYLVTDAIMGAFPRADGTFERGRLIGLIGAMSPQGTTRPLRSSSGWRTRTRTPGSGPSRR